MAKYRYEKGEDGEVYAVYKDVPIFKEHVGSDDTHYTKELLQKIADNNNHRIKDTGDLCPVVGWHTPTDGDPSKDPPVIGWADSFHVERFGKVKPTWAIYARFRIRKDHHQYFKDHPRRSVEIWPEESPDQRYIDPIAVLGAETPRQDLGLVYSKGAEKLRYSADYSAMQYDAEGEFQGKLELLVEDLDQFATEVKSSETGATKEDIEKYEQYLQQIKDLHAEYDFELGGKESGKLLKSWMDDLKVHGADEEPADDELDEDDKKFHEIADGEATVTEHEDFNLEPYDDELDEIEGEEVEDITDEEIDAILAEEGVPPSGADLEGITDSPDPSEMKDVERNSLGQFNGYIPGEVKQKNSKDEEPEGDPLQYALAEAMGMDKYEKDAEPEQDSKDGISMQAEKEGSGMLSKEDIGQIIEGLKETIKEMIHEEMASTGPAEPEEALLEGVEEEEVSDEEVVDEELPEEEPVEDEEEDEDELGAELFKKTCDQYKLDDEKNCDCSGAKQYMASFGDKDKLRIQKYIETHGSNEEKSMYSKIKPEGAPQKETKGTPDQYKKQADQYKKERDALAVKYKKQTEELASAKEELALVNKEARKQMYSARLTELETEGYAFDKEKEIEFCMKLSDELADEHIENRVTQYAKMPSAHALPIEQSPEFVPVDENGEQTKSYKYAKAATTATSQLRKLKPGVQYKEVLDWMVANDTDKTPTVSELTGTSV